MDTSNKDEEEEELSSEDDLKKEIGSTIDYLMMRLHMIKLECNFRSRKENQMCEIGSHDNANTEHYFACKGLVDLQQVTNARAEDRRVMIPRNLCGQANSLKKVEMLIGPKEKTRSLTRAKQ